MIAVIDYKAGNLTSVLKAMEALGAKDVVVTADPAVVQGAERIILPGVGHFQTTQVLSDSGITDAVRAMTAQSVPFLGICVGLQWLFEGSTEATQVKGLGAFQGMCERFETQEKVPHVGWNSIAVSNDSKLMHSIDDGAFVYYTHSYQAPLLKESVAITEYGGCRFTGAVERGNVMGVQFHPEKSAEVGLHVLKNFVEL